MLKFISKNSWVMLCHVSLTLLWYFGQVYVQCVKSAVRLFCSFGIFEFLLRSTLYCFSFEYCWFSYFGVHSDCALSVWANPAKFKQFRPIYRSFKPEKLNQTEEIREIFTKFRLKAYFQTWLHFGCVFFAQMKGNSIYIKV